MRPAARVTKDVIGINQASVEVRIVAFSWFRQDAASAGNTIAPASLGERARVRFPVYGTKVGIEAGHKMMNTTGVIGNRERKRDSASLSSVELDTQTQGSVCWVHRFVQKVDVVMASTGYRSRCVVRDTRDLCVSTSAAEQHKNKREEKVQERGGAHQASKSAWSTLFFDCGSRWDHETRARKGMRGTPINYAIRETRRDRGKHEQRSFRF